ARRLAAGAAAGALTEGATEGAQAAVERFGAQQELTGQEAYEDYLENIAAGALGGGVMGGAAGVRRAEGEVAAPPPNAPGTLALPPPPTMVVAPDGTVTPNSPVPPQVYAEPEMRFPQGRGMSTSLVRPRAAPLPALPPPGPLLVDPEGNAGTETQRFNAAQAQQQADVRSVQGRESLGLTPDVNAARAAHPGAIPNRLVRNLPNPANGPLSRAVNVAAVNGALSSAAPPLLEQPVAGEAQASAAPVNLDTPPALQPLEIAPPPPNVDAAMGEVKPWSLDQVRGYLVEQADRAGSLPPSAMIASAFGMKPRVIGDLRREVLAERRARMKTEQAPVEGATDELPAERSAAERAANAASAPVDAVGDAIAPVAGAPVADIGDAPAASGLDNPNRVAATPAAGAAPAGPLTYDESTDQLDDDITPPSGRPYSIRDAADREASRRPEGRVFEVEGGFVVRQPTQNAAAAQAATAATPARVTPAAAGDAALADLAVSRDVYGKTVRVRASDLAGANEQLPLYDARGRRKLGQTIHRENLDPDGAKASARPGLPVYAASGRNSDKPFKTAAAAALAVKRAGQSPDAYAITPWQGGFVATRKPTSELERASAEAAMSPANDLPEPSEAQREAGNYRKGHARVAGLDVSIESPAGTRRRPEWPPLKNHYGYFKGTTGKDKDHVDVFLTDQAEDESRPVFVVDQVTQKGRFDEHKVVMGAADEAEARAVYLSNYAKGWTGLGSITRMTLPEFRDWVSDRAQTTRRAAAYARTRKEQSPTDASTARAIPATDGQPSSRQSEDRAAVLSTTALTPRVRVKGGQPYYAETDPMTIAAYFQPGRIVPSYGGQDRVISFTPGSNGDPWSVSVQAVDKDGNPLIEDGQPARIRSHRTSPTKRELIGMFGLPQKAAKGEKVAPTKRATKASTKTPEPTVPTPVPENATALEETRNLLANLRDGNATADDVRASFARVRDSEAEVKAELNKLTKPELRAQFNLMRDESKGEMVDSAYRSLLSTFTLGTMTSFQITGDYARSHLRAVQAAVDKLTDADITAYAEARRDAAARRAERIEGVKNPQTLEDYETLARVLGTEAKMTPEQRAGYDRLRADAVLERRASERVQSTTVAAVSTGDTGMKLVETKHTKKGHDLFVVQMDTRVERDVYDRLNKASKQLGGHYSAFRGGGAVPGFQFTTREAAEKFMGLREGDQDRSGEVEARADAKRGAQAESLTGRAQALREGAQATLNADRKTNTRRRASMAASAESNARAIIARADTMDKIAAAIEAGTARTLSQVRFGSQVGLLDKAMSRAVWDHQRAAGVSWEKAKESPITVDMVANATLPKFTLSRADAVSAAREMYRLPGGKQLSRDLTDMVDYKDEYNAAVSASPFKFAAARSDGKLAFFRTKTDAQAAIARTAQ
ncbi:MAG: hypothetical protein JF596_16445, partial [Stenotrophomonas sp.]|nr:hypothetical protein [Stenotrophomonas sp.]